MQLALYVRVAVCLAAAVGCSDDAQGPESDAGGQARDASAPGKRDSGAEADGDAGDDLIAADGGGVAELFRDPGVPVCTGPTSLLRVAGSVADRQVMFDGQPASYLGGGELYTLETSSGAALRPKLRIFWEGQPPNGTTAPITRGTIWIPDDDGSGNGRYFCIVDGEIGGVPDAEQPGLGEGLIAFRIDGLRAGELCSGEEPLIAADLKACMFRSDGRLPKTVSNPPPPAGSELEDGLTGHCGPIVHAYASGLFTHTVECDNAVEGVPNPESASTWNLELPDAMRAGEPYAISALWENSGAAHDFEIWGTNTPCGPAEELLWWGPVQRRPVCADFVPTQAHGAVILLLRQADIGSYALRNSELALCSSAGMCPGGRDGMGLEDGVELMPPPGLYDSPTQTGGAFYGGYDTALGSDGRLVLLTDGAPADSSSAALVGGVVRLPSDGRFGDAWYCVGAGSSYAHSDGPNSSSKRLRLSLRNLTRLPSCDDRNGSSSATAMASKSPRGSSIASSQAALVGEKFTATTRCQGSRCEFTFNDEAAERHSTLRVEVEDDLGTPQTATAAQSAIREAVWFVPDAEGQVMRMTCAHTGNVDYDPDAATQVTVSAASALMSCPGTAVSDDEIDLVLEL
jgi:hypothetical protein